jgi:hypothetical protein
MMVISRAATAAIRSLQASINLLGVTGQLVRADDPEAPALTVRFLRTHPQVAGAGRRDEQVVNAFGIGALIITFPPLAELLDKPPAKFDLVQFGTPRQTYALDTVLTRMVDDTVTAFTGYVRGHVA